MKLLHEVVYLAYLCALCLGVGWILGGLLMA